MSLVSLAVFLGACTGDDNGPVGDAVPPAAVTDLVAASASPSAVTLTWTAVGDDENAGTASQYDIRYSISSGSAWGQMTPTSGEPAPKAAGQSESFTVTGLAPNTTHWFAMKVADEVPNWSAVSNEASATPSGDAVSPAAVADLVAVSSGPSAVTLTWTAVGDDENAGTASQYDIRYSTSSGWTWGQMTPTTGEPAPKAAGQLESFTVTGLTANTTYWFAMKVADEVPNWSEVSNEASATTGQTGSWSSLRSGVDESVYALGVYGGDLVVGGMFTLAGEVPVNRIARWDGTDWNPLGSGVNGSVLALAVYEGNLIAAGTFTEAGGLAANHIAQWDGTAWSALGSGTFANVLALGVYYSDLIVGGNFTQAGGLAANHIAQWDGTAWSLLGSGVSGESGEGSYAEVISLTEYNGDLIAGGAFDRAGGATAHHIARWDSVTWSPLDSLGMNDSVRAFAMHDGCLIAGGRFSQAGGVAANNIARWDGTVWNPIGLGLRDGPFGYGGVRALTVYNGDLIAGGWFGLYNIDYIMRWDGGAWVKLGSGTSNDVRALTVHNGDLIAGGLFHQAGGVTVNHIARWHE